MILIKNGNVVLEDSVKELDILIKDGKVLDLGKNLDATNCILINAKGRYILPGLIDMNCILKDPGYEHKEDLETMSNAALAGGYSTLACVPVTHPVIDNKVAVEYVQNKISEESKVDILLYGRCTKDGEEEKFSEISEMKTAGVVGITDGNRTIMDTKLFNNLLTYCEMFNLPIINFSEDRILSENGVMHDGKIASYNGLCGIPREAEEIIVARNILLSRDKDVPMHFTCISSRNSIDLIDITKKSGRKVTCDCTINHLYFTDDNLENYDTIYKVSPPFREEIDCKGLLKGIKEGVIDCIVSGHNPENAQTKQKEFDRASIGVSSLETAFLAGYNKLVIEGHIDIIKLTKLYSTNPSKILRLDDRGVIKVGKRANLLIFDPEEETKILSEYFLSKSRFSMYEGMTFKGKVITNIVNGKVMYKANR